MKKRSLWATTLSTIMCALLLLTTFGCTTEKNNADTVTIGTTAAIEKAVRGEYNYDMLASGNSEIPLVWQDTSGEFHPLLASFSTEDSQTWIFTVEDGMTWSDGEPVTANDILFTLQYEDEHGGNYLNGENKKYQSAEVSQDGKSISLTLVSANVRELCNMTSFRVMPKHIYQNKNDEQLTEKDMRVVCGPYVLQSFDKNSGTLTYTMNKYYPQKPKVQKLVYKLFSNEDTLYFALQSGDIDAVWNYSAGVPQTYADVLKNDKNINLLSVSANNAPAVLMFNNNKAPFDDANVRNAVSYALNYEQFKSAFGGENAKIANRGFVAETMVGYKPTEQNTTDFAKATQLLAASGYSKNTDGYFEKDGTVLQFTLMVRSSKAEHVRYAELVKNNLEYFGIKVNLESVDGTTFNIKTSNKFAGENNTDVTMQAAINGYTAAGMSMGDGLGTIYVNKNHAVQGGCQVSDEKFFAILAEMNSAQTPQEYNTAAGNMQDYYASSTPMIALFWNNTLYAHSARLQGFVTDAVFGINNVNTWFSIDIAAQ